MYVLPFNLSLIPFVSLDRKNLPLINLQADRNAMASKWLVELSILAIKLALPQMPKWANWKYMYGFNTANEW